MKKLLLALSLISVGGIVAVRQRAPRVSREDRISQLLADYHLKHEQYMIHWRRYNVPTATDESKSASIRAMLDLTAAMQYDKNELKKLKYDVSEMHIPYVPGE